MSFIVKPATKVLRPEARAGLARVYIKNVHYQTSREFVAHWFDYKTDFIVFMIHLDLLCTVMIKPFWCFRSEAPVTPQKPAYGLAEG